MLQVAQRTRTSLALGTAGAVLVAALVLSPRPSPTSCRLPSSSAGILTARTATAKLLPGEQHVALTIAMPEADHRRAPAASIAIVIDRSGSMEGEPLANAKAAAMRLIDELGPQNAFTVVTYSSSDETVMPIALATPENKAAARAAIEAIWEDGNTCISCGIERGTSELALTPVRGGVRRMVLISDGQANTGRYDRNDLADLAAETAGRGISITMVGVGLDFDEVTMMRLADAGHGNYYFVENTAELASMFMQELGSIGATSATDARLVIEPGAGVSIDEIYGYPMFRQGSQTVVPLADLRDGEVRKVVLRVAVDNTLGTRELAQAFLHYRHVGDGTQDRASARAAAIVTTDASAVAATVDRAAMSAIEQARSARVLEDATTIYERDGYDAAQRMLERHKREVRDNQNLDPAAMQAIETASEEAIVNFAKAPAAKAKKATRSSAYQLAR
jgi:Ca-activated chloride channel homolog